MPVNSFFSVCLRPMQQVTIRASAKINLELAVGPRRGARHQISGRMLRLPDVADVLHIGRVRGSAAGGFRVSGPCAAQVPPFQKNSVGAAVRLFFGSIAPPSLNIHLKKNLPARAGLGGGSSDGVAAIRALGALFPDVPLPTSAQVLSSLGSDALFFWADADCAQVGGCGEELRPVAPPIMGDLAVGMARGAFVESAWAYEALATARAAGRFLASDAPNNHFQPLVFEAFPSTAQLWDDFCAFGARAGGLTGSGGAIWAEFPSRAAASRAAEHCRRRQAFAFVQSAKKP